MVAGSLAVVITVMMQLDFIFIARRRCPPLLSGIAQCWQSFQDVEGRSSFLVRVKAPRSNRCLFHILWRIIEAMGGGRGREIPVFLPLKSRCMFRLFTFMVNVTIICFAVLQSTSQTNTTGKTIRIAAQSLVRPHIRNIAPAPLPQQQQQQQHQQRQPKTLVLKTIPLKVKQIAPTTIKMPPRQTNQSNQGLPHNIVHQQPTEVFNTRNGALQDIIYDSVLVRLIYTRRSCVPGLFKMEQLPQ